MPKISKKLVQKEFNHLMASGQPCAYCHQTFPVMQCSHVHSIGAYPNLRFDPMNVLPLCGRHHLFWWHDRPLESSEWFKHNYKGRDIYLTVAKNKDIKWTDDKLKEVRQYIKEGNLRKLLIMPELINEKV